MSKSTYINTGLRPYINPHDRATPIKPGERIELTAGDAIILVNISQGEIKPLERYKAWLEPQPDARLQELCRLRDIPFKDAAQARAELAGDPPPTPKRKKKPCPSKTSTSAEPT